MSGYEHRTWTVPLNTLEERCGWAVVTPAGAVELRAIAGPAGGPRAVQARGQDWTADGVALHSTVARDGWSASEHVCQIFGDRSCWTDLQYLPADALLAEWAAAGGDDTLIWDRLEALHTATFEEEL